MRDELTIDGRRVGLRLLGRRPRLALEIDGIVRAVAERDGGDGAFELELDGTLYRGWRHVGEAEVHVRLDGRTYVVDLPARRGGGGAAGGGSQVRADMPGTVVALHCSAGAAVAEGAALLTIESMKLQMTIVAPRAGSIAELHVEANASFERGAVLVSLAVEEG